ncbi:MAG: radical SAM protein, partial [Deltaproteobacteria bacterium]|nr:radical SAM protein [Deltaproteobacteria bacterium]
ELANIVDNGRNEAGFFENVGLGESEALSLLEGNPHAVCFSAYCWNIEAALFACGVIKKASPATKTVIGGRAVDGAGGEILYENPSVDFVISGEGEIPFNFLAANDFDGDKLESAGGDHAPASAAVAGVSRLFFRSGAGKQTNSLRFEPVRELDSIPSPYLAGVIKPPPDGLMMEISRGCLNNCGYCAWNSSKLRRSFSRERLESELGWAVKNGYGHITLVDSAINYEMETLSAFVSALKAADPGRQLSFTYNLRHEVITPEQIELLREIPPFQLLIGMESLTPDALSNSDRKRFDTGRFEETVRMLAGIAPPVIGVILGLPGDTLDGFKQTMEYLAGLQENSDRPLIGAVLVSLLQVFRGTGLYAKKRELGIKTAEKGIPYLIENGTFTNNDLKKAVRYLNDFRARHQVLVKGPEGLRFIIGREMYTNDIYPQWVGRLFGILKVYNLPVGEMVASGGVLKINLAGSGEKLDLEVLPGAMSAAGYARTAKYTVRFRGEGNLNRTQSLWLDLFLRIIRKMEAELPDDFNESVGIGLEKETPARMLTRLFPFCSVESFEPPSVIPAEILVRYTFECNQECPFCSSPLPVKEPSDEMLLRCFNIVAENIPGSLVTLTGGEPTLRKNLSAHVDYLLNLKDISYVKVQTNAVGFSSDKRALEFQPSKRLQFFISLHSLEEEIYDLCTGTKGQMHKAIKGILNLHEKGHWIVLNIVLNRYNIDGLPGYIASVRRTFPEDAVSELHFSILMCPEHRSDAPDFLAPYGHIVSKLEEAAVIAEDSGLKIASLLGSSHASIPPCFLAEKFRSRAGLFPVQNVDETGYEDFSRLWVKADSCRQCREDRYCLGLPGPYAR